MNFEGYFFYEEAKGKTGKPREHETQKTSPFFYLHFERVKYMLECKCRDPKIVRRFTPWPRFFCH